MNIFFYLKILLFLSLSHFLPISLWFPFFFLCLFVFFYCCHSFSLFSFSFKTIFFYNCTRFWALKYTLINFSWSRIRSLIFFFFLFFFYICLFLFFLFLRFWHTRENNEDALPSNLIQLLSLKIFFSCPPPADEKSIY